MGSRARKMLVIFKELPCFVLFFLQHVIRAPKSGVIEKLFYSSGQAVNRHAQLVQFQELGEEQKSEDDDEEGPEAE